MKFVDVTARDGLQSWPHYIDLQDKIKLVDLISRIGVHEIEAGAFVSPEKRVQKKSHGPSA